MCVSCTCALKAVSSNYPLLLHTQVEGSLSESGTPASYSSLQRLELGGHRSDVRTCALSDDGTLLATASNTQLKVRMTKQNV